MNHTSSRSPHLSSRKVLTDPAAPPPLKWRADVYPRFLSGSVHFFAFILLFFVSLLISSLWCGQWRGILQLCCCCLFSTTVYNLSWSLSDQVRADTLPAGMHRNDLHLSDSPRLWLVVLRVADSSKSIMATGWSHRQLTCIWFYRQIIMTILANITKTSYFIVTLW